MNNMLKLYSKTAKLMKVVKGLNKETRDSDSDLFEGQAGLRQGCIWLPRLFNVYTLLGYNQRVLKGTTCQECCIRKEN